jgi:transglutaminase-like putative cysteine protease
VIDEFPATPWCVPDTTDECYRITLINRIANEGMQREPVQKIAHLAKTRALLASGGVPSVPVTAIEVLRAVQSIPYVDPNHDKECLQRTDYTIANGGECKALSAVLVAVARLAGLQADPVWVTQTGLPMNHVTSVIYIDGIPEWADASVRGAALGENPWEAVSRLGAQHVIGAARKVPNGKTAPIRWMSKRDAQRNCPYLFCDYAQQVATPEKVGYYSWNHGELK